MKNKLIYLMFGLIMIMSIGIVSAGTGTIGLPLPRGWCIATDSPTSVSAQMNFQYVENYGQIMANSIPGVFYGRNNGGDCVYVAGVTTTVTVYSSMSTLQNFCYRETSSGNIYTVGVSNYVSGSSGHITVNVNPFVSCVPSWNCGGYDACELGDIQQCNSVYDANDCGETYTGDYSEFITQNCDFCTPDWSCNGYDMCNEADQELCNSVMDINNCGETYIEDYSEFMFIPCDYCTPEWVCSDYELCPIYPQDCIGVTDTNLCGELYIGDYNEFTPQEEICCTENWEATYTDCKFNEQTLTFVDSNNCGTTETRPENHNTIVACKSGGSSSGSSFNISDDTQELEESEVQSTKGVFVGIRNFFNNVWDFITFWR